MTAGILIKINQQHRLDHPIHSLTYTLSLGEADPGASVQRNTAQEEWRPYRQCGSKRAEVKGAGKGRSRGD